MNLMKDRFKTYLELGTEVLDIFRFFHVSHQENKQLEDAGITSNFNQI